MADVLDTRLFDFDQASQLDAWMAELEKEHTPESETYGLDTHIYRAGQPFDSAALQKALVGGLPRNVIRSKGWVGGRPGHPVEPYRTATGPGNCRRMA